MSSKQQKTLLEMNRGESGVIVSLSGGNGFCNRMENLGIRPGKTVTKICSQPLNGPIQIKIENIQIAIGRGMANKIIVECES